MYPGDCQELLKEVPDNSIDLIFTDPPWDNKSLYLYECLANEAERTLTTDGFIAVYTGNDKLPEIMEYFSRTSLKWFRMFAGIQLNSNSRFFSKKLFANWRPIVVYAKGSLRPLNWMPDAIKTNRDKKYHPWGQDAEPIRRWIEGFTNDSSIVLDPCMGGGATGAASILAGRKWLGFDKDEDAVRVANERLTTQINNMEEE